MHERDDERGGEERDDGVFDGHAHLGEEGDGGQEDEVKPDQGFEDVDVDDGEDVGGLGPDTETELEPEFRQQLEGPGTEEYAVEAGTADDAGDEDIEDSEQLFEPPSEELPVEAEQDEDAAPHGREPEIGDTQEHEFELEPADDGSGEEAEAEGEEPVEAEEEGGDPDRTEVREPVGAPAGGNGASPAQVPAGVAVAAPGATFGLSPAEGGVPAGMKPPPGFVPTADTPDEHPPRPHLFLRFLLAALIVIGSFGAATSITIIRYFSDIASKLGHHASLVGVREQLESVNAGTPQTIMIIGSDRRYQETGRGRSDTTILLRLDPGRNAISLLSIPRDLKVNIPGHGVDKFNAAYTYGGPRLTLKVVRQLTGLHVNHLVNVDFAGFFYAINAIGCVFVDVDHHYYHSNAGLPPSLQYAEINIKPGYQRLCGEDALAYVRYRHQDNDLVRSARQHDFLREARQKVGPSKLIGDRKQLIDIFTRYTSSDIDKFDTMLSVLKLFLASRSSSIKEVHFPGKLGGTYVTASPQAIHAAVGQFLGITGTPGPRGNLTKPLPSATTPVEGTGASKESKKQKKKKKKPLAPKQAAPHSANLFDATAAGKEQGFYAKERLRFPVYYPTKLKKGSVYAQKPHVYAILHAEGHKTFPAYRMVVRNSFGEYYGVQGMTWKNPPMLRNPSEVRKVGGRTFLLFYDNDRLRLVAWKTKFGTYWLNNTLLETLSEREMLGIAATMGVTKARRR